MNLDLINAPDIAQTIVVTCFGLGIECYLTGLHTLKIKETDRLVALKNEIEKLGGEVVITDKTLHLKSANSIKENIHIATYDDHRMAMAFAPLALKVPIEIEEANVVSKSYPDFWKDFENHRLILNLFPHLSYLPLILLRSPMAWHYLSSNRITCPLLA